MTTTFVIPAEVKRLIEAGAKLIDIRDREEYAREHIPGAVNMPMVEIDRSDGWSGPVMFQCRSGVRTRACAGQLAAAAGEACYVIEGGIDAWRRAGLNVVIDRSQLGAALGFLLNSYFFALSAFVGAGLILAGATGWCGMARLLRWMPWNRRMAE